MDGSGGRGAVAVARDAVKYSVAVLSAGFVGTRPGVAMDSMRWVAWALSLGRL